MFFLFHDPKDVPDYGTSLVRLAKALDAAREIAPDISVSTLATFLTVSMHGKELAALTKTLPQLSEEIGVPYSRMMRHLDVLSDGTPSSPGHGLLLKYLDPRSKRNRKYSPSEKGDALIRKMTATIDNS